MARGDSGKNGGARTSEKISSHSILSDMYTQNVNEVAPTTFESTSEGAAQIKPSTFPDSVSGGVEESKESKPDKACGEENVEEKKEAELCQNFEDPELQESVVDSDKAELVTPSDTWYIFNHSSIDQLDWYNLEVFPNKSPNLGNGREDQDCPIIAAAAGTCNSRPQTCAAVEQTVTALYTSESTDLIGGGFTSTYPLSVASKCEEHYWCCNWPN